ncbi:MAG: glycosyltransferase family 9 protein [Deltaproteobacteria bacterium]|nr:glycosyltransferase family 9 protein [Deltaproteobacteria bacterium]
MPPIPAAPARLLLVKLSSLGDVVHTLPTLEALRAAFPRGHLTWLVEEAYAPLLAGHPALDAVWTVPRWRWSRERWAGEVRRFTALTLALRRQPFDLVVDLQGLLKSAVWVALAQSPRKVGFDRTREGSWRVLTERLPPYDPDRHALLRCLDVARYLGAAAGPPRFRFPPLPAVDAGAVFAAARGRPLVILHPGARWDTKLWPGAYWREVARGLLARGSAVAITGGPADREMAAQILDGLTGPVLNLAGRTTLLEAVGWLRQAALAVTTDTGPMHLAAALGVPVAALFGPTAPWRTGPLGEGHQVLRLQLPCSPCFRRRCPDPRCLTELPPAMVLDACGKILNRPEGN